MKAIERALTEHNWSCSKKILSHNYARLYSTRFDFAVKWYGWLLSAQEKGKIWYYSVMKMEKNFCIFTINQYTKCFLHIIKYNKYSCFTLVVFLTIFSETMFYIVLYSFLFHINSLQVKFPTWYPFCFEWVFYMDLFNLHFHVHHISGLSRISWQCIHNVTYKIFKRFSTFCISFHFFSHRIYLFHSHCYAPIFKGFLHIVIYGYVVTLFFKSTSSFLILSIKIFHTIFPWYCFFIFI